MKKIQASLYDLKGERYYKLLDYLSNYCNQFAFILPPSRFSSYASNEFIVKLEDSFIEGKKVKSWGCTTFGEIKLARFYQFNELTKNILKTNTYSLYESFWRPFPENISFFKETGDCFLWTHSAPEEWEDEKDSLFPDLQQNELEKLSSTLKLVNKFELLDKKSQKKIDLYTFS